MSDKPLLSSTSQPPLPAACYAAKHPKLATSTDNKKAVKNSSKQVISNK